MTVIKKALKIFWKILVVTVSILFAAALLLQLPQVQTFIAGKVVESLDDKLDADINFEKIHFRPFRTLVLKNVEIIDRNPVADASGASDIKVDTFFRAEYIIARFTLEGLIRQQGIHLDEARISNAQMNLVLEDKPDAGDGDTAHDNLSRIFRLKKPETPKQSEKEIFFIRDVKISDMGFSMRNHGSDKTPYHGGINWNDLDVKDIDITAEDLHFKAGIMSGHAERVSFREKSGYRIESISGNARVGRGKTIIENLKLKDPWSRLDLPEFMMSYENLKAFKDFISRVRLDVDIADSRIDFKTITYFAPQLEGNRLKAGISGRFAGYVDNFDVIGLKIASDAGGFTGTINGSMKGLPEIEKTTIDAKIDKFNMTTEGLGLFLSEWMKDGELDLSRYAKGHTFMVTAKASGLMSRLDINADI